MANNLADFTPEVWSKAIEGELYATTVGLALVNRKYENEIKTAGDTVHIRRRASNIAVNNYTKETGITWQDIDSAKESLVVDQQKYFAFKIDDIDAVQNDIDTLAEYARDAAEQVAQVVDQYIFGHYASVLAANQVTGSAGADLDHDAAKIYGYIVEAGKRLDVQNVPQSKRWMALSPTETALLLQADVITHATDKADKVITEGYIGRLAGFDLYMSNNIVATGGSRYCLYGTSDGIYFASQIIEIEAVRLESYFGVGIRGLEVYGSKVTTPSSKYIGYLKFADA